MGQLKLFQLEQIFKEDKAVYIFDEPTNFLDARHKQEVIEAIANLGKKGKLVLFISHDAFIDGAEVVLLS